MANANWRLDNPPVVDVEVSRRMGLFVVAQLAARHGIRSPAAPGAVRRPERAGLAARRGDHGGNGPARAPALRPGDAGGASAGRPAGARPQAAPREPGGSRPGHAPARRRPRPRAGSPGRRPGQGRARGRGTPGPGRCSRRAEASLAHRERLPIFDAVESDWFAGGGRPVDRQVRPGQRRALVLGGGRRLAGRRGGQGAGFGTAPRGPGCLSGRRGQTSSRGPPPPQRPAGPRAGRRPPGRPGRPMTTGTVSPGTSAVSGEAGPRQPAETQQRRRYSLMKHQDAAAARSQEERW